MTPSPGTEKPKPFPPKLNAELGLVLRCAPAFGVILPWVAQDHTASRRTGLLSYL